VIDVRGLTKRFGATVAVDDLSFSVASGRVTGFLGPNGAGKSTTLRCMLDLDHPDRGSTSFDGRSFTALKRPLREVGALLDAGYVHPSRTARNHLLAVARSNGIRAGRVDEVLAMVGMSTVARTTVGKFSLGMRQRLGLALAMLGDPPVLLLDEPANGLDPEGMQWVRAFLKALADQGRTVFVSSHLLAEMALMADDLVVIGRGRLLAQTSVSEFVAQSSESWVVVKGPEVERLVPSLEGRGARVARLDGGADGPALRVEQLGAPAIGELAFAHGVVLHELSPRTASLEEAFLQATADAQEYRSQVPFPAPAAATGGPLPPPDVPAP
jgi:ABC-2 type transport system ATP-binding protein